MANLVGLVPFGVIGGLTAMGHVHALGLPLCWVWTVAWECSAMSRTAVTSRCDAMPMYPHQVPSSMIAVVSEVYGRVYGIRARLRWFRREARSAGRLIRWMPLSWFLDPLVLADMTSPWERAWIARYLARDFDGSGAIVELGTWLGSSTLAIVDGLRRNKRVEGVEIHVYDLFCAEDIEERMRGLPTRKRFRDGESFLPQYLERLGDRKDHLVVHQGDVLDHTWQSGHEIQFLFNDLSKSWDIWNHVKKTFYRELKRGAVVVEQDWVHSCTPWLHLWHFKYRDDLTPVCHIPNSGSVVFRVKNKLPNSAFDPDCFEDYSSAEVLEAFDWAIGIVNPARQADVRGALVHLYALYGDPAFASRLCIDQLAIAPVGELLRYTVPELSRRLAERDL